MIWNEIDWLLVFSQKKCQGIIKLIEVYLWKYFENTWTVQVYYESGLSFKTRRVFKRREKIFEIKEDRRRWRDYPKSYSKSQRKERSNQQEANTWHEEVNVKFPSFGLKPSKQKY